MNIYLYPNYRSIDQELQEKEEGKKIISQMASCEKLLHRNVLRVGEGKGSRKFFR
jgi:hypothetical protein